MGAKLKLFLAIITAFGAMFFFSCKEQKGEKASNVPILGFYEDSSLLQAVLKMSLDTVLNDIGNDNKWHDAIWVWSGKSIRARVKTRGNFRRDPDNCNFPPLFIKLDSAEVYNTPFQNLDRLVLVSHCQNEKVNYEQYVLEEYAIYRMYALFTEYSFGVRLAKIRYQDLHDSTKFIEKNAFFTEGFRDFEKRKNGKLLSENDSITYFKCNSYLMTQAVVFQFFIANTDWSVSNKHNVEVLKTKNGDLMPVIYDFDMSGLIDAEYAAPTPELGIESVTDRLYRGYCESNSELPLVFDSFREKRPQIEQIWHNLPNYNPERKQRVLKFIDNFYKIINNPDSVEFHFKKNCR